MTNIRKAISAKKQAEDGTILDRNVAGKGKG